MHGRIESRIHDLLNSRPNSIGAAAGGAKEGEGVPESDHFLQRTASCTMKSGDLASLPADSNNLTKGNRERDGTTTKIFTDVHDVHSCINCCKIQ